MRGVLHKDPLLLALSSILTGTCIGHPFKTHSSLFHLEVTVLDTLYSCQEPTTISGFILHGA